jgi:alkylation response protein AidB-like acyl-CoA dehydrogenase
MEFLAPERRTLDSILPGLDSALASIPLNQLESRGNDGLRKFRESGGPGLLIPRECAGCGATPLEALRIQRAIGSRSPSLAIATTMHQFSVVSIVEMARQKRGAEMLLLEAIARQRLLVASGFAEGRSGVGILSATMRAKRTAEGFVVNGSKKPCSLTYSMDLLTASATVEDETGSAGSTAVLLIPAQSSGIDRRPFWSNWVLAGAESDEVVLTDVKVPDSLAWIPSSRDQLDPLQISAFLWFELLITASYLGMASALAEQVIKACRGQESDRTLIGVELEGAMAALEGVARSMMAGPSNQDDLARMLLVRYSVEKSVERATDLAVALLGGMAFIQSANISYLLAASRGLAFHPPSRASMAHSLANYLAGGTIEIP